MGYQMRRMFSEFFLMSIVGKKKYEILRCEVKPEEFEDMFLYFPHL